MLLALYTFLQAVLAGLVLLYTALAVQRVGGRDKSHNKKRILMLANRVGTFAGETGGGSYMRESLLRDLKASGDYEVHTIASGRSDPDMTTTVRGPMLTATPKNVLLIAKEVCSADIVILSGSYSPMLIVASLISAICAVPCLFIITTNSAKACDGSFTGLARTLALNLHLSSDRLVHQLAMKTFTRSQEYARVLGLDYGIKVDGVMSHNPQYRDFSRVHNEQEREQAAEARHYLTGGKPQNKILLYAGRIRVEKRIPLLVEAFKHAYPLRGDNSVTLAIVGDGADADAVQALHDPASNVLVFREFVDHARLRCFFHASDVHVSASNFETLGNTVHESLLCGTPVVVQNAGGYISQVRGPNQGYLVDYEDAAAVKDALDRILYPGSRLVETFPVKRDTCEGLEIVADLVSQSPKPLSPYAAFVYTCRVASTLAFGIFPYQLISVCKTED